MGQTIQQRQLATLARAHAANAVRFSVVLTREQANGILGQFDMGIACDESGRDDLRGNPKGYDIHLRRALYEIQKALHTS